MKPTTMTQKKLKPCPFCGEEVKKGDITKVESEMWIVHQCKGISANITIPFTLWNTRAGEGDMEAVKKEYHRGYMDGRTLSRKVIVNPQPQFSRFEIVAREMMQAMVTGYSADRTIEEIITDKTVEAACELATALLAKFDKRKEEGK